MPDLNPIAKRIHNIQPRPVRLAIDGDDAGVFEFSSTEFFQREFRGGDPHRRRRRRRVPAHHLGRLRVRATRAVGPRRGGWTIVGEVTEAESAEE